MFTEKFYYDLFSVCRRFERDSLDPHNRRFRSLGSTRQAPSENVFFRQSVLLIQLADGRLTNYFSAGLRTNRIAVLCQDDGDITKNVINLSQARAKSLQHLND